MTYWGWTAHKHQTCLVLVRAPSLHSIEPQLPHIRLLVMKMELLCGFIITSSPKSPNLFLFVFFLKHDFDKLLKIHENTCGS